MDVTKNLKLSAKTIDLDSRWDCKYTRLQVFELMLFFRFFMVKKAFHLLRSDRRGACRRTGKAVLLPSHQKRQTERIWGVLQELVKIITETFETDDERVLDALINRSETFKHYIL